MSKLLKEAIADAKAVRETALANAKLALEEAFAPKLQSMLTKKLREDDIDAEIPAEDDIEELPVEDDEVALEDDELPVEDDEVALEDDELPVEDDEELPVEDDEVALEDDEEGDLDLESIIKELEDDLGSEEDELQAIENEVEDEEGLEEQSDSSELGIKGDEHVNVADSDDEELPPETDVQSAELGDEGEEEKVADIDEEIDLEIVEDDELEVEDDEVAAEDDEVATEDNSGGDIGEDDEEINLEEILRELEEENQIVDFDDDSGEEPGTGEKLNEQVNKLTEENDKLKKENTEYRKVYKYMRGKLNEVNLLNAKLLYTNKLFKKFGLNEDQKLKVVESFDLTKNVREAKLVYATLSESFSTTPVVAERKRPSRQKKTITEGFASKPIKSTKPSKEILSESAQQAERFKHLAGIV